MTFTATSSDSLLFPKDIKALKVSILKRKLLRIFSLVKGKVQCISLPDDKQAA